MAEQPARKFYYSCGRQGDGLSQLTAFRPSIADLVLQHGGSWATCCTEGALYVVAVSDRRGDGSVAGQLHGALAREPGCTFLGVNLEAAKGNAPPQVAAKMNEAFVVV